LKFGRLLGTSEKISVSGAFGVFETRPAVTKLSCPPSGRLAVDRYPSAVKRNLSVGFHSTFNPNIEVVTTRSTVLFTISGWKSLTVIPVTTPFLITGFDQLVPIVSGAAK